MGILNDGSLERLVIKDLAIQNGEPMANVRLLDNHVELQLLNCLSNPEVNHKMYNSNLKELDLSFKLREDNNNFLETSLFENVTNFFENLSSLEVLRLKSIDTH